MISIIIPVYNAEKYLRKCMESVCRQTYADIEIIVVDDGSTDGSLAVLQECGRMDERIKIFTQENSGQGAARNKGIAAAGGEYISFVDADDWLEEDEIETLYQSIVQNQADIAVCNLFRTCIDEECIATTLEELFEGVICDSDDNYVFNISSYPVGKLYKRELFASNGFAFPEHFYEDVAAIPILFAKAKRISFVKEAKYYYRNHSGSTVYALDRIRDRVTCLYSLVDIFKKNQCYEKYRHELGEYLVKRIATNVRMMKSAFGQYEKWFIEEQNKFLAENFPESRQYKPLQVVTWGSFNSYTVSKILMNSDAGELLADYYGGESIISLLGKTNEKMNFVDIYANNPFRFNMLKNDFTAGLLHRSISEFSDCNLLLLDFLEERFPVGLYEGNYFTISDAYTDKEMEMGMRYEKISLEEKLLLWKEKAGEFARLLERYFPHARIVLLRMKLSEYYGDKGKESLFPEIAQIQATNEMLDGLYDYFEEVCARVISVHLSERDFYYTYTSFRHGCYPWHLRQGAYSQIAKHIRELLEVDRKCAE